MDQQQYCLKWSNYSSNLAAAFSNLFDSATLTDVTLVCGGTVFNAHKVILAACSKNFADLFERAPVGTGQICVMLEATSADNMHALLEFMYKGEVHVSQKALESFLKAAENLQVKGLTTEHGRFASANAGQPSQSPFHNPPNDLPSPATRRQQRNSLSSSLESINRPVKRESDSVVGSASCGGNGANSSVGSGGVGSASDRGSSGGGAGVGSGRGGSDRNEGAGSGAAGGGGGSAGGGAGGGGSDGGGGSGGGSTPASSFSPYLQPAAYMPPYDRKRPLRSPFYEHQEATRDSVLRDGKASAGNGSPVSGSKNYRPSSSGSSATPTEADTIHTDRDSPQQSNRYENHSPSTTHHGHGNGPVSSNTMDRDERNDHNGSIADKVKHECREGNEAGAEDLRVKLEMRPIQSPLRSSAPSTPTTPVGFINVKGGLEGSIPSVDMLGMISAPRETTGDGKKLQCPLCDRQYGYETNLRAHIRQRHQGIRVPCPYCSRTFTRNNTVRRHIAREHKQQTAFLPSQLHS
ncbi:zinc finger protein chinmo [Anopheles ziemanni]|uniref:zinc finger protein chinmo n=1 Tax=Anopheles coustani TaxID=139045 RepID=UPI00265953C1|nr:zinc finger protein chinmo [Anopheles coustani]XP_058178282.1 zinc finger protein chinmo [Anopheles ziemanni]